MSKSDGVPYVSKKDRDKILRHLDDIRAIIDRYPHVIIPADHPIAVELNMFRKQHDLMRYFAEQLSLSDEEKDGE